MVERLTHPISPLYDASSQVLILGSFPSPKSREYGFFYGHPQNRFWACLAALFDENLSDDTEQKRAFAIRHKIALWDVIQSCEIKGADDSSIRNPVPNSIEMILNAAPIQAVFTTGRKSHQLFQKLITPKIGVEPIYLPSPSPANCAMPFDKLVESYRVILPFLAPHEWKESK